MPGPSTPASGAGSVPRRTWARRDVLTLGALSLLGSVAGCTPSTPVITGPTRGTASPSASSPSAAGPAASTLRLAAAERSLGDLAGAILTGPHRRDLSSRQRAFLAWLVPVHAEHAAALDAPDPGSRPPTPPATVGTTPSAGALSLAAALRRLAE
ncbi:MAG: hypothetical protein JWP61_2995, partial [Friedmanniella sp.]|nr:hypothetical protein [Friedmanniella sp.]